MVKALVNKNMEYLDNEFNGLIKNNMLSIESIENLVLNNINEYKKIVNTHIEELISKKINEKELITKKNKSG